MKAYKQVEVKLYSFLTSGLDEGDWTTRPSCLMPGKESWYPLNRKVAGTQSWSAPFWRREKSLAPTRIQTLHCPAHSLFTKPNTLAWIPCSSSFLTYLYRCNIAYMVNQMNLIFLGMTEPIFLQDQVYKV
jgi:hypothetical protein